MTANDLDSKNAAFWRELCGSSWARMLGIRSDDPAELARFDAFYFGYYPYLDEYVDEFDLSGKNVLEIGLGYGTLGQRLAERGAVYHGLDISPGPVEMMRHRLRMLGLEADERVVVGTALAMPFADQEFDAVYAIGSLHHTGDLSKGIEEVHRVLRPGGHAIVMIYNRFSARQLYRVDRPRLLAAFGRGRATTADTIRSHYDSNAEGTAAPHTDFTSKRQVRRLFDRFSSVAIRAENLDDVVLRGRRIARRERLIGTPVARALGLDLYVVARR